MRQFVIMAAWLALVCAGQVTGAAESATADAKPTDGSATSDGNPQLTRQDVPGSVQGREVAEVTLDEIKPAFTEATVLKLNAIVRRSLRTAGEYTSSIKSVRNTVAAAERPEATMAERDAARAALEQLGVLHEAAIAAREDMDAAATNLEASGESYSEELLAGMMKYTRDVEASLAAEIQRLNSTLVTAGR